METYLTVDVGNSSVSLAVLRGRKILLQDNVDVSIPLREFDERVKSILRKVAELSHHVDHCILCSVVPKKTARVKRILKSHANCSIFVIGKDIVVPLVNRYKNPEQVGCDRLLAAFAAQQLYGQPAIIIDFGTAITFDALSVKNEYLGGVIVPGMRLSLESLHAKTAMLPRIKEVRRPSRVIGKTTEHSILSGVVYGYGEMCQGMVARISKEIKGNPRVVITGGYAHLMVRFLKNYRPIVDQDLVHKGMMLCHHSQINA